MKRARLRTHSVLKRKAPLKRRAYLRSVSKTNSHRRRPRDPDFMKWVSRQPCLLANTIDAATPCSGRIHVDHAGNRFTDGDGTRAHDNTCIPLCEQHHAERTGYFGHFKHMVAATMRAWCNEWIVQHRYIHFLRKKHLP